MLLLPIVDVGNGAGMYIEAVAAAAGTTGMLTPDDE